MKRKLIGICILLTVIAGLGAFDRINRPSAVEYFGGTSGAGTTLSLTAGRLSCSFLVMNDDSTATNTLSYQLNIAGTGLQPAVTVRGGESIGFDESDGVCVTAIRIAAVNGTPAYRVIANEVQ